MRKLLKRSVISALLVVAVVPSAIQAESVGKLVARGNRSFAKEDYDGAIELYEKASVKAPESPVVYFNIGDAYFKKGDFEKARENFEKAAEKTEDLGFEALSWYNMGNCAFKQAERQQDGDLQKALDYYKESIQFYETALKKDPDLRDAAYNLEVARLVVKDLLDRIKKQEEMMRRQQERMKAVVDSLRSLIKRQGEVIEGTKKIASRGSWTKMQLEGLKNRQEGIVEGTRNVQSMLDSLFSDKKPPQAAMAHSHLDSSTVAQYNAVDEISRSALSSARSNEEESLKFLLKALEDLTSKGQDKQGGRNSQGKTQENKAGESKNGQDKQNEQQSQQQVRSAPRDETARAILDEEKENRKRRQKALAGGYRPVEKDW